jgi:PadR family transcriptional regulator, regulatory protein PadR
MLKNTAKSDLPQGTLDLLILKVVAMGPIHGYAIAQRLEQISRGVVQVPEGSLYPALHRLENRRFLSADWKQTETGREAKFYSLTRKGQKHLEAQAASWQRLTDAIGLILGIADEVCRDLVATPVSPEAARARAGVGVAVPRRATQVDSIMALRYE